MGLKNKVLVQLLKHCDKTKNYAFHNDLVKKISKDIGFSNPFDAAKLDNTSKFPDEMLERDLFIVHLGEGKHQFLKGISKSFHEFEPIKSNDIIEWTYKKSLLNEYDTSESNILSLGFNQRIIHDFLYEDITANPKLYNARRTKSSFDYYIGKDKIDARNIQMEIDLTMELNGNVAVFEGKNNFSKNFAVYQIFHPFLYFQKIKNENRLPIKNITCCYLIRKQENSGSVIRIYNYTFSKECDMASIVLIKSKEYRLIKR